MRLLIVDDSTAVRTRLVSLLRESGLEVAGEAATAAEGLRLATSLLVDAVVLDLQLPDGNGLDLLPALKRLAPAPLVLVLANLPHPLYRERCLALGADLVFDKSREFEAVAAALLSRAR